MARRMMGGLSAARSRIRDDDDDKESVSLGEVRLKHATKDAILVEPLEDNEVLDDDLWVPKSQVHDDSEVYDGMEGDKCGELKVTWFWADKKGFV